jgi:hypothetical protein
MIMGGKALKNFAPSSILLPQGLIRTAGEGKRRLRAMRCHMLGEQSPFLQLTEEPQG